MTGSQQSEKDDRSPVFGEALRASRVRSGFSQRELAERAGVSLRAIRYLEQGLVERPRHDTVLKLATALGNDFGELISSRADNSGQAGPNRFLIGVLGPLVTRLGSDPVHIGPLKQRTVLALLALEANKVVPRSEIVDVLWGDRPPSSWLNLVHTYVSGLRRALDAERPLISSVDGGYQLTVDVEELDLLRFDELAATARRQEPEGALLRYETALALWRGPVLADLPASLGEHPAAVAAASRRVAVAMTYADLALPLGGTEQVVEHLRRVARDNPLHEGLQARLMLALAGSGQQAAALDLFTGMRRRLAEELGVGPGAELRDAHLRIIRDDPAEQIGLGLGTGAPPAQLPPDIEGFVGRDGHLARLDATCLDARRSGQTAVVISAIAGTAGVGKTALAVHWAHRAREHFPDGQLYANLRGYAPGSPVRPVEVLTRFLRGLGVSAERVPTDEDEAIDLYRTMLTGRRVLVVLDNAASVEQVRPLLPGSSSCQVLVTSRDQLTALAATTGARRLVLDVLEPADAEALLTGMVGEVRAEAEPQAVAALAKTCAYLPIALRIAGANLASAPLGSVSAYVGNLRERGRLAELAIDGDPEAVVRTAFDLSYESLEPGARRLFGLIGLVPGPDFTAAAAAELTETTAPVAQRALTRLVAASLVTEYSAGRYQLHDLLREYAADRAWTDGTPSEIQAATARLFDYYLQTVDAATSLLYPQAEWMPLGPGRRGVPLEPPKSASEATDWLDAERTNLFAAVIRSAEYGVRSYAWRITDALRGYLWTRGYAGEGMAACQAALRVAKENGDKAAEGSMSNVLGLIHYNVSDYRAALICHTRALVLSREMKNRPAEASSQHNIGRVHSQLGQPAQAAHHYEQSLVISRETGNPRGEATALNYLGAAALSACQIGKAESYALRGLELTRRIGDRDTEARTLHCLGLIHWARGDLLAALEMYMLSLTLARAVGIRYLEAGAAVVMAETYCDAGRFDEAEVAAQLAIKEGRKVGERRQEVGGLDVLGTIRQRLGDPESAVRYYESALTMAVETSFGFGTASVLIGLCAARRAAGLPEEAVRDGLEALALMQDKGMRLLEVRALTELAHAYLDADDQAAAESHAERAVTLARTREQRLGEARALLVLGHVRDATGDDAAARTHWAAALVIFSGIGTDEAGKVRGLLGAAGSQLRSL